MKRVRMLVLALMAFSLFTAANLWAEAPRVVIATGGIGGVHRDAAVTFDISADLTELARSRVAVVCSGVKSILDIGATFCYLD